MMPEKILVTGGAGFIGSFLTESLLADGYAVTVVDNFSTGSMNNLAAVKDSPQLKVLKLDVVENAEAVAELVRDADCIFHLAAAVGVEMVVNDPVHTLLTNVRGTENVLVPAAKAEKRIILASTSEVYGKSTGELFKETDDLHLGSPHHSRWSYACSKLLDEFILMAYHHQQDLPGTIVRFFNTVGPRQTGRYGMVVPRFVKAALAGEPLKVYGDGQQSRCFCHVYDVVRALKGLLHCQDSIGRICNIGSQELISIEDLAKLTISRLKSSSELERIPYEQAYGKGFEDMRRRRPDTSEINRLTGWAPEKTLCDIIDDTAQYFRNHSDAC